MPKIKGSNLDTWIDESISLVGSNRNLGTTSTRTYSSVAQQNMVINTAAPVQAITNITDNTLISSRKPKRSLPFSPPISVSNRFEILQTLEVEAPVKLRKVWNRPDQSH